MATEHLPLPMARDLFFSKGVDQASMEELTKQIIEINENDDKLKKIYDIYGFDYKPRPIKMFIDSYGGYVYQCFGLLSVMEKSKTPIHTIVTGAAMSCGFMILICGHKRFAYENATPMYHQVGSGTWGKLKDLEEDIEETKRLQNKIEEITLKKTKISKKKLEKVYKTKRDWYMNATEAVKQGVVDEII